MGVKSGTTKVNFAIGVPTGPRHPRAIPVARFDVDA